MFISLKPPEERGGISTAAGDRPAAPQALSGSPASACSCSRRRTSAPAAGRAIPTTNIRCRAPISICCRNGPRSSPSAWRRGGHHRRLQRPRSRRAAIVAGDRPQDRFEPRRRVQDIDNALNNAFAQRQISIIYTQRNQYMVVLEIDPKFQAIRPTWSASSSPAPTTPRCRYRPWCATSAACRRSRSIIAIVSLDDGLVQSAARRAAGGRDHQHPARGRGTAHAGRHPRQFRRQCRRFQQDQRAAAAADPRRAGGDVYRARRAL